MHPFATSRLPTALGGVGLALLLLGIAACDGTSPSTPSTPSAVPVFLVRVSPNDLSITPGQAAQLTATPVGVSGQPLSNRTITWETANASVATVSASGIVTGVSLGATIIRAISEGRAGIALVTVREPVARVTVVPSNLTLVPGEKQPLTATALGSDDQPVTGLPVAWTSSAPQVATVDDIGRVTGLSLGSATITARIGEGSGTALVLLVADPASVAGIWDWTETIPFCSDTGSYVFSQTRTLLSGTSAQVGTCQRFDRTSNDLAVSLIPGIVGAAAVSFDRDNAGSRCHYFGALDAASATITGTVSCFTGTGTWRAVRQTSVGQVRVAPLTGSLLVGASQSLIPELSNTDGQRVFSRPATWASGNNAVATVSASGTVTGIGPGSTQITTTVEGLSGSAEVTVQTISFTAVAAGGRGSCGLTPAGEIFCWGLNPVALASAPAFSSLSVGLESACGLTGDGSAYCWGDGSAGELGIPGVQSTGIPLAVAGGFRFTSLTGGGLYYADYYYGYFATEAHTCGLVASGTAYCWGLNSSGQLGTGTQRDSFSPAPVSGGFSFTALSAGGHHTCGLTSSGAALCWGNNASGQLGRNGGSTSTPTPVAGALTFKAIAAGTYHTCGITTSGAAYCWGYNGSGQLGSFTALPNSSVPVPVAGGLSFVSIVAGDTHTCALTTAGQAYCWGSNDSGQLGIAQTTGVAFVPTPVALGLTYTALASGSSSSHTCGITGANIVYCWGSTGNVGGGDINIADRPVRVLGQP